MANASPAAYARLKFPNLVAFAGPNLCIGALAVALGVYLPRYYAAHFGLSLTGVGMAFMAVRLSDTLLDPFIGVAIDRTRTRFGRYRPWLVLGTPVLMVAVFMLFVPPGAVSYVYLFGWLLCYYIGTSLITLSHASWASAIAAKYDERSRVFGVIQLLGVVGATAALILPVVMAHKNGSSGQGDVPAMGWFVIVSAAGGVLLALLFTPERVTNEPPEPTRLAEYWRMVSRPDMRRIIIADFCLALGPGWMAATYLFYFHDARGFSIKTASLLLLIYVVAGLLGAAVMSWVATRLGKHRTIMIAAVGYSLGLIGQAFLPKNHFEMAAPFMFLMGFLASSFPLLDRAMVADVGDAVRLEQGVNRVSLLYAMITTSQKVATALAIGFSFNVLGLIGYKAKEGAVNTPQAIFGMECVYLLVPIVFVMIGGLCYIGYKLDGRRHAEIRTALAEADAQTTEEPVIEGLTGVGGIAART